MGRLRLSCTGIAEPQSDKCNDSRLFVFTQNLAGFFATGAELRFEEGVYMEELSKKIDSIIVELNKVYKEKYPNKGYLDKKVIDVALEKTKKIQIFTVGETEEIESDVVFVLKKNKENIVLEIPFMDFIEKYPTDDAFNEKFLKKALEILESKVFEKRSNLFYKKTHLDLPIQSANNKNEDTGNDLTELYQKGLDLVKNIPQDPETYQNVLNVEGRDQEEQKAALKSMTVYRVMRLEHFKSWCESNQNVLVPVEWWDDPWERALFKNPINICKAFSLDPTNFKFYGQCWSLEKEESDATWRIFKANDNQCVRVGVNAWDLYKHFKNSCDQLSGEGYSLHSCFAGLVKYMEENDIVKSLSVSHFEDCLTNVDSSLVKTLFIKRMAFKHEKEFRLIYYYATNEALIEVPSIPSYLCGDPVHVFKPKDDLIKFDFPISKIKSVTIGPKISHCPCELHKRQIDCDKLITEFIQNGISEDIISVSDIYDFPELNLNY